MTEWLSVKQAAEGLGTSVQWVHRLIEKDDGKLEFQRIGAYYVVSAASVRRLKRKSRERRLRLKRQADGNHGNKK